MPPPPPGVPFVHAGDDLLRSKSLDRDSYNSGDHFNRVDWTGRDNNFGVVRFLADAFGRLKLVGLGWEP
jgi:pullulanase/glycogen debranching enzyme